MYKNMNKFYKKIEKLIIYYYKYNATKEKRDSKEGCKT